MKENTVENLICLHEVEWEWVKGHAGHRENEIADQLSQEAIKAFVKSLEIHDNQTNLFKNME